MNDVFSEQELDDRYHENTIKLHRSRQHSARLQCEVYANFRGEGATWTLSDCLVSSLVASKALIRIYPSAFQKILVHPLLPKTETLRWRYYGADTITGRDGVIPVKTIIDLSAVRTKEE